jgi:hypothetical protein
MIGRNVKSPLAEDPGLNVLLAGVFAFGDARMPDELS